jgi:hypothetical protein
MSLDLAALVDAPKRLPVSLKWRDRGHQDWLDLVAPLDIDGVTVEGLRLRGTTRETLRDENVMFQLEYTPPARSRVRGGALWRIEWRPLTRHENKGCGPVELRYKLQTGSHHHPFHLNWTERAKDVRRGQLPIAIPFPNGIADTYAGLIAFVGEQFKIENASIIPLPPWLGRFI